jgi:PKD repeat protein
VPRSLLGNPAVGTQLNNFLTRISDGSTITPDNMPQNFTPLNNPYTIVGNASCVINTAPVAALVAHLHGTVNPPQGDPPLAIDFDGSGSSDADAGDSVVSYTFDFGDGSPVTTQSSPTVSHTYTQNGQYAATLKVTDSHGKVSSNTGLVDIDVDLPLNDTVSQKTHGTAGTFGIHLLNAGGVASLEMRGSGPTNNAYSLVYTFDPAYRVDSIDANGVALTSGGSSIGSVAATVGPGANQMTVNLTGVPTAQHLFITANGVHVTRLSDNATATLNTEVPMDLLVGDVDGNGRVDGNDVSAVQSHTRQIPGSSTFQYDLDTNGRIDGNDVSRTQSQTRTGLP